jgi:hypothetical protein
LWASSFLARHFSNWRIRSAVSSIITVGGPKLEILKLDQERHQIDSAHDRMRGVHNAAPIRGIKHVSDSEIKEEQQ